MHVVHFLFCDILFTLFLPLFLVQRTSLLRVNCFVSPRVLMADGGLELHRGNRHMMPIFVFTACMEYEIYAWAIEESWM